MIMASHVEVWNFKPKIKVDVVLLASFVRSVILTTGTGNDKELVIQAANGVSVPGILEFIHGDAVKRVSSVVDDLIALLQRRRILINFATTDEEELITRRLDVHEVVLEALRDLNGSLVDVLCRQLVLVDKLGVPLQDVDVSCLGCTCAADA